LAIDLIFCLIHNKGIVECDVIWVVVVGWFSCKGNETNC
jgi:hypothetical protein